MLASPWTWTEESYYYPMELGSNLPMYNGKVEYNPLFYSTRRNNIPLMPYRLSSPGYRNLAGFPVKNSFNFFQLQELNDAQHTWLGMFLTEPPVKTGKLDASVPVRTNNDNSYHVARETLHDPRGLTFRTMLDRVKEIFQSDMWRTTRRYRFCRPGLARVRVELFAGDE